jgi:hypothetical protein
MKNLIWILLLVLCIMGCKKEDKEAITIHGKVKHYYSGNDISGILVRCWLQEARSIGSSAAAPIAEAYSDIDGNFTLNFEVNKSNEDSFVLWTDHTVVADSNSNAWKYDYGTISFPKNKINEEHILRVVPGGTIEVWVSDDTWSSINADTIVVQSPYITGYLMQTPVKIDSVWFSVDPSQYSSFRWSYIKNDVYYQTTLKDIFVPNGLLYSPIGNPTFRYELTF